MPYPTFQINHYVDSIESVRSLRESSDGLIDDYMLQLQKENQELKAENENLKAELEKEKPGEGLK